jgi:hypothetical protein
MTYDLWVKVGSEWEWVASISSQDHAAALNVAIMHLSQDPENEGRPIRFQSRDRNDMPEENLEISN